MLCAQRHNGIDDVVVILLEGFDGLLPGHTRLLHDQLDVLGLEACVVLLLAVVLFLFLLVLGSLALAVVVIVVVVVAGVIVRTSLSGGELLGS